MDYEDAERKGWIEKYIKSRVKRGSDWRSQIDKHKEFAEKSIYIRILGGGFRPVSISDANPCGHLQYDESDKQISGCKTIERAILKASSAKVGKLEGNKPEHRIQASLIRHALMNDYAFGRIDKLFHGFEGEFDELHFITDEFSVTPGGKIRACRADIIALGRMDGTYFPVFIEIKVKHELKRLIDQLTIACDQLWNDDHVRGHFSDFVSAVSSIKEIDPSANAAKKMLIWADINNGHESKAVEEARKLGFLIAKCPRAGGKFVKDVAPPAGKA